VMDGWQFLKEQQVDGTISSVPVIVVTAVLDGESKSAATQAVAFLQKPIDVAQLMGTLRQHC